MLSDLTKGIIKENPLFVQLLGVCPSLATSGSLENAVGMGCAFTFVLFFSNIIISLIRKLIPDQVHIPAYIVVIASLVTILEMLMNAFVPALYESLGVFVPLIVVNCIVLGRAEAFACKHGVVSSALDAIGMGLGFTFCPEPLPFSVNSSVPANSLVMSCLAVPTPRSSSSSCRQVPS